MSKKMAIPALILLSQFGHAGLPDWINSPPEVSHFQAVSCVAASNDLSIDRAEAALMARAEIAQNIETTIEAVDEVEVNKNVKNGSVDLAKKFKSTLKSTSQAIVKGSRIIKAERVRIGLKQNFCVLVAVMDADIKNKIHEIGQEQRLDLSVQDEDSFFNLLVSSKKQG